MSGGESTGKGEVFEVERIRQLVELMKEHDLSEIHLRHRDQQIRLRRGQEPGPVYAAPVAPPTYAAPPLPVAAPSAPVAGPAAVAAPASADDDKHFVFVRSPMVGTFYARSKPEAEPFVKVGDRVEAETTVCVIEAMKMFTPIQAEVSGTIVAILVKNEEPVDVNKPLFKVDPRK